MAVLSASVYDSRRVLLLSEGQHWHYNRNLVVIPYVVAVGGGCGGCGGIVNCCCRLVCP